MTIAGTLYHRFKRHRSLQTSVIKAMPLVVLMPHSGCNCRCVMCDIWKDNQNRQQLSANDISRLLVSLKKLGTQQVLMSGGEALLHPAFFHFCELLREEQISVVLLSTGLTLKKHAQQLTEQVSEIIVSLDGDPATHDRIRNIAGAFDLLEEGVKAIRQINPAYRTSLISGSWLILSARQRNWGLIRSASCPQMSAAMHSIAKCCGRATDRKKS